MNNTVKNLNGNELEENEWMAKRHAAKTRSLRAIRRLSQHESEFVRLTLFLNPNIKGHLDIVLKMALRDRDLRVRDAAISMLEKARR